MPARIGCHNLDGFVRSPSAALRFIFRHCSVPLCTPHSSRFGALSRLWRESFFTVSSTLGNFCEIINLRIVPI